MSRKDLFLKHSKDLSRVCEFVSERFVCPICFNVFLPDDLGKKDTLSEGHVWPQRYFRDRSPEANKQVVLLCHSCNSKGGHTYDAAMQAMEESLQAEENGDVYMRQIVYIYPSDHKKEPIRMQLFVLRRDGGLTPEDRDRVIANDGIIVGVRDNPPDTGLYPLIDRSGYKHYGEEQWLLAKSYLGTGGSMNIHPYDSDWSKGRHSDTPMLWRIGLLTAAYLYSFYTFGYRYIFQACLDPVRNCIEKAFSGNIDFRLDFDKTKSINVARSPSYFPYPDISFLNPFDLESPHHLRVHFLSYAMWLPIRQSFVYEIEPNDQFIGGGLALPATGHLPHDEMCHLDLLLGESDYKIQADDTVIRA